MTSAAFLVSNTYLFGVFSQRRQLAIALKRDVCREYFSGMGIEAKVHVNPLRDMPHGRSLRLIWDDKVSAVVRFDQGMGCWNIDGKPPGWFDLNAPASNQVTRLYETSRRLKIRFGKSHSTQIFVKVR